MPPRSARTIGQGITSALRNDCGRLSKLDLDDPMHQREVLRQDKHTRIEGLCVEHLFRHSLLGPVLPEAVSGFWFTRKDGAWRVIKFLPDRQGFQPVDGRVLDHLMRNGLRAWVVYHDRATSGFRVLPYRKGCMTPGASDQAGPYPRCTGAVSMPAERERDAARHAKAFNYLEEQGVLRDAAIERLFANCWIGDRFFWDIDCFAFQGHQLTAFEVKQKYPTKAGTFGLNTGLTALFSMLTAIGVRVLHVVLTKPENDINVPALDLFTLPEHLERACWIATEFKASKLSAHTGLAPAYTSIHGTGRPRFHHISPSHFHFLGKVGAPRSLLGEFLADRTLPLVDLEDLGRATAPSRGIPRGG